ncbi:hypothetical protein FRB99_004441 [Tulasnella sp. 403]|nr:hypothetical protein FRB99_004441 [Tulasnella sp. 403]
MHPIRQPRLTSTVSAAARNPPIPPSLLDSPFVQSPNSPFRRDQSVAPPNYSIDHDALNLLDTVPMGLTPDRALYSSRRGSAPGLETEPTPDDIGVAGTPKSARSSSITSRPSVRPQFARGNSWILQQQQDSGSRSHPQNSPSQSTLKLPAPPSSYPPSRPSPSNLPLSTPYPPASSRTSSLPFPASSAPAPTSAARP